MDLFHPFPRTVVSNQDTSNQLPKYPHDMAARALHVRQGLYRGRRIFFSGSRGALSQLALAKLVSVLASL